MPPKGYKLGYVKNKETGEYVHPSTLAPPTPPSPPRVKAPAKTIQVEIVSDAPVIPPPTPPREDAGPVVHPVKDDREYAKVIIVWRDAKGKEKTTAYVMANLSVNENVDERFTEAARKQTRIHMSLEGDVLEKQ